MEGHGSPAFHVPWLTPCQSLPSTPLPHPSLLLLLCHFSFFLYLFPPFLSLLQPHLLPFFLAFSCHTRSLPLLHSFSVWEKTRKASWRKGCPSSQALSPFISLHRDLSSNRDCSAMEFTVLLSNAFPVRRQSKKAEWPECCKTDLTFLI